MSFDDDNRDADWRAYLIKTAKAVTDAGIAADVPITEKPAAIGERYGYEAPRCRLAREQR